MLTWPTELPLPEPDAYSISPVDVAARTKMGEGAFRTRRRALVAPQTFECQFTADADQKWLLDDFYEYSLRQGTDTMLMPVFMHGSYRTRQVVFTERPTFKYKTYIYWTATCKFSIPSGLGTTIYRDLTSITDDKDVYRALATFTTAFRVPRVDIFIRTPPDSGTTDLLRVGFVGDVEALVEDIDISNTGHLIIVPGHANAGGSLNVLVSGGSLPKTVQCRWASTGSVPTEVDVMVRVPFTED